MKKRRVLVLSMVVMILLALVLPAAASVDFVGVKSAQSSCIQNNSLTYTREDIRKKLSKKFEFDYTPYLKGKKNLDFEANDELYRTVYYYIKQRYVEPVDNSVLTNSIFAEVSRLLKQAKVDPTGIKKIPRSGSLMNSIINAYGDKVDSKLLALACIRGMLEGLNDPHSVLMLPSEYESLAESMRGGNFTGIGVYIMSDPDNYNMLTISEPIEGTPAYSAGVQPGDVIVAINGEPTKGQPMDVAITKIRGPAGTVVNLTIQRKGVKKTFVVPIKRAFIHVKSVGEKILGNNVGYIKLRVYGKDTGQEIESALRKLEASGAKAIILDLRNNSGGLIDSAVDVCSKFLPRGTPVVTVINRQGNRQVYRANGGSHGRLPMVVMINELSASASEITAGALKDHKRATLLGEKSFGKGSVQELMPLDNTGSKPAALKLTIALFYTPNGTKINKAGLEPDVKVPMDIKDAGVRNYNKDIQLQKAVKYLKSRI